MPELEDYLPGECDNCMMSPGEHTGPPFYICCACTIGDGATPENCRCGPGNTNA